jgi:hypothetical protein
MISLLQPLELEYKNGTAGLMLWLCEALDTNYSFRSVLAEIENALGGAAFAAYKLPPEIPNEDFIDGSLDWGGRTYSIYFERMLGYMQFSSSSLSHVEALRDAISQHCQANG